MARILIAGDCELCESLHDDIALSYAVIEEWVRSGCLASSLAPPDGPKPPSIVGKPPSQRF